LPTITPPEIEDIKHEDNPATIKSRFLRSRSAFSRMLLFFLSNISKFAFQVRVNRSWLETWYDLAPLSIPLMGDGVESIQLDDDESELHPDGQMTWQKVVDPPPNRTPVSYPPRPMIPPVIQYIPLKREPEPYRGSPKSIFWVCMIVLLVLVGAFGVTGAMGRRSTVSTPHGPLSLQVTPQEVATGAMMSLRGANFSPQGHVGLTRDASIPILDTGGVSVTRSDAQGNFTDTVQVQANWGSGSHTINAEDALTHKITSFPVMVLGDDAVALRPSHLQLSIDDLNLGSGDQATNSEQAISLTNLGSGQISWQGSTTQSWLMMTPQGGTFYSGTQSNVIIAVDRASMQPGSYSAQVLFTSNVGDVPLNINMQVTPLDAHNEAVLQVSPPVLSFTGNDGGFGPAPQVVTVSNPGVQPLNWIGSTNVSWLSLSESGGTLQPANNAQVTVSADTSRLLPGTYSGSISISAQGSDAVLHSLQTIDVTVIVTPYCALMFSSGTLSFTAAYLQPDPFAKTVDLASSLSCPTQLNWNVTSNASWLSVSNWSGTTPGSLSVSIHANGLAPGSYSGELTFTSSAGSQKLLVYFTLGPAGNPVMSVDSPSLTFGTVMGTKGPAAQTVKLTNSGARPLFWHANAMTQQGGSWLSISPVYGSLTAYQSTMLSVAVNPAGLTVGTYNGTVVINAVDSITGQTLGPPQRVSITLNVGPACTLQAPSMSAIRFSTAQGTNPATQTFHVSVTGTCFGNVTVTPTITSGSDWLAVSPTSAVIGSGESATFTVSVTSASLKAGLYSGSISLSGVSDGVVIAGSSQAIKVTLDDQADPAMKLSATSLSFSTTAGSDPANQTIQVSNVGGGTLKWSVGKPSQSWLSVSPSSGTCVAGSSSTLTFAINAKGLAASGTPYQATVVITPSNGAAVTVTVTLTVNAASATSTATPS